MLYCIRTEQPTPDAVGYMMLTKLAAQPPRIAPKEARRDSQGGSVWGVHRDAG